MLFRSVVVADSTLPLSDVVVFDKGAYGLDIGTIRRLVDSASTADERHTPSTARREARKLDTEETHEAWAREYRRLRHEKPGKTDRWYSQKIAASRIGGGRSAETIRKQMIK